jgi:hypothetical protein
MFCSLSPLGSFLNGVSIVYTSNPQYIHVLRTRNQLLLCIPPSIFTAPCRAVEWSHSHSLVVCSYKNKQGNSTTDSTLITRKRDRCSWSSRPATGSDRVALSELFAYARNSIDPALEVAVACVPARTGVSKSNLIKSANVLTTTINYSKGHGAGA